MTTWITDDNGNRASITYWGDEARARASLATLTNCRNCTDCSRCSDCSGCSYCSYCSYCSNCSGEKESNKNEPLKIPKIENIHKKIYEAVSQPKALQMGNWHICETAHCRAGWVVHLAGEEGYALEKRFNTEFAAMQIYKASGYSINPCRFYDSNEAALEDMRKLAEIESKTEILC